MPARNESEPKLRPAFLVWSSRNGAERPTEKYGRVYYDMLCRVWIHDNRIDDARDAPSLSSSVSWSMSCLVGCVCYGSKKSDSLNSATDWLDWLDWTGGSTPPSPLPLPSLPSSLPHSLPPSHRTGRPRERGEEGRTADVGRSMSAGRGFPSVPLRRDRRDSLQHRFNQSGLDEKRMSGVEISQECGQCLGSVASASGVSSRFSPG